MPVKTAVSELRTPPPRWEALGGREDPMLRTLLQRLVQFSTKKVVFACFCVEGGCWEGQPHQKHVTLYVYKYIYIYTIYTI